MIPVRLQLKNFMSYGEGVPPLDLTGVRLACLSGDNGNGKTALLDAMTWALFGETRASSEDDVVRLGASDCQVFFDFEVGNLRYRVRKGRGKRGAGASGSFWELQIWQEDGSLRSLSGTNARETKAKIEQLLRMDYRTFLASGYLAQGRADEFARATVTERKKVLADILDLSRYERLEEMAKERRKDAEDRETDAQREISGIDAQLEREDYYRAELAAAQERLAARTEEIGRERAAYERVLSEIEKQETHEQRARDLEEKSHGAAEDNARDARALADVRQRIAQAEPVAARREQIIHAQAEFRRLTEAIRPLEEACRAALGLQREAGEIERRIREAYEALERERYQQNCDVQQKQEDQQSAERYRSETTRLDEEIAGFGDPAARATEAAARREEAEGLLVDLRGHHGTIKAQAEALQTRLNALHGSDAANCEYCGQPLPPERRRRAIAEAETEAAALTEQQADLLRQGKDAKQRVDALKDEERRAQADFVEVQKRTERRSHTESELRRVEKSAAGLEAARRALAAIEKRIAQKDYAQDEQARLADVHAELHRLEQTEQRLAEMRTERARYESAERDALQLEQAEETLRTEPPRAKELEDAIAKREGQIAAAAAMIAKIRAATTALPNLRREQGEIGERMRLAEEASRAAEREIGHFSAQIERCAGLREQRVVREDERKAAAREKDLYRELVAAFGKKGVQALIIENALPEIETQANDLLSRMTSGAMQLRLLTTREAKSKTAAGPASIETLDIVLSDDMGTRPYEMFSGGEAFRINFALRVALSRMLARRAGAPLQTLILDEGFGTQDPRGREAIIDALHTISEQFALILVITHIDELKEAFPTRIEVTKGPEGSTFSVM